MSKELHVLTSTHILKQVAARFSKTLATIYPKK